MTAWRIVTNMSFQFKSLHSKRCLLFDLDVFNAYLVCLLTDELLFLLYTYFGFTMYSLKFINIMKRKFEKVEENIVNLQLEIQQ